MTSSISCLLLSVGFNRLIKIASLKSTSLTVPQFARICIEMGSSCANFLACVGKLPHWGEINAGQFYCEGIIWRNQYNPDGLGRQNIWGDKRCMFIGRVYHCLCGNAACYNFVCVRALINYCEECCSFCLQFA